MTEHDAIEQLAALLDGEDVPGAPSSVATLATLAESVRDHADLVAPTPEFRSALRAELVASAEAPPGLVDRLRTAWQARTASLRTSARVAVATVTASSMIGSAGVAVAAQQAMPGDMLYGLKGLTEDARLLLATDAVGEARLHLEFARERLDELRATAGALSTDEVVELLAEMDAHSEAGAEALLAAVTVGAVDPLEVQDFTADQRNGLVSVLHELPVLAQPVAQDSLELLRRIEVNVTGIVPCDCPADGRLSDLTGDLSGATGGATLPLPTHLTPDVAAPGEGPAVPADDCDCIELPGGSESREPSSREDAEGEAAPDDGRDERLQPTEELSSPERSDDGEDDTSVDAPSSDDDLTVDDTTDTLDRSTSGVDEVAPTADTEDAVIGDVTETTDGVGDLLD